MNTRESFLEKNALVYVAGCLEKMYEQARLSSLLNAVH